MGRSGISIGGRVALDLTLLDLPLPCKTSDVPVLVLVLMLAMLVPCGGPGVLALLVPCGGPGVLAVLSLQATRLFGWWQWLSMASMSTARIPIHLRASPAHHHRRLYGQGSPSIAHADIPEKDHPRLECAARLGPRPMLTAQVFPVAKKVAVAAEDANTRVCSLRMHSQRQWHMTRACARRRFVTVWRCSDASAQHGA